MKALCVLAVALIAAMTAGAACVAMVQCECNNQTPSLFRQKPAFAAGKAFVSLLEQGRCDGYIRICHDVD